MVKIIALLAAALVTGCAAIDPRDAPWDPPQGRALFEQLPPWDRAADRICCGHLPRAEFLKNRCDTDHPTPPRSNRC